MTVKMAPHIIVEHENHNSLQSKPEQSTSDLRRTKRNWHMSFSQYFSLPITNILPTLLTYISFIYQWSCM